MDNTGDQSVNVHGIPIFETTRSIEGLLPLQGSLEEEANFGSIRSITNYENKVIRVTESQYDAICFKNDMNVLLSIRAGPGCGKTRIIVARIAYLICEGKIKPEHILVLSMANRSVKSLRRNLAQEIGNLSELVTISTFHSLAGTLLDVYGSTYTTEFANRNLLDGVSWSAFSKFFSRKSTILNGSQLDVNITHLAFQKIVTAIRSGSSSIGDVVSKYGIPQDYISAVLEFLEDQNIILYSDLISDFLKMVEMSKASNKLIPPLHNYKVVIVDEFQDMYPELISMIQSITTYPTNDQQSNNNINNTVNNTEPIGEINRKKHITIAGDPNQSIYQFLGSDQQLMLNPSKVLPNYEYNEVVLKETFRSTPEILTFTSHVTKVQTPRSLNSSGYKPIITPFNHFDDEVLWIVTEIIRLMSESGGLLKPSDFAILTRTNDEIKTVMKTISYFGLEYNHLSSNEVWINSPIHNFIHILRILRHGDDSKFSLLCILQFIDKNISRVSRMFSRSNNLEKYLKSKDAKLFYKKSPETLIKLQKFLVVIEEERKNLPTDVSSTLECLFRICQKAELLDLINKDDNSTESNLKSFQKSLLYSYQSWIELQLLNKENSFLDLFLRNYNESIPIFEDKKINVSTIHSAKGLEFPVVFLAGTYSTFNRESYWSSLFNEQDKRQDKSALHANNYTADSEKARLFYVASTRAKCLFYMGVEPSNNIYKNIINATTRDIPVFSQIRSREPTKLLLSIAGGLSRPIPSAEKLLLGSNLYKNFRKNHQLNFFRQAKRSLHFYTRIKR